MIKQYYDKILLGISLLVLAAAFALAAMRPEAQPVTEFVDLVPLGQNNTYEVSELTEPDFSVPEWQPPRPQSAGENWVFDLFTPPDIYFNEQTGQFTVIPGGGDPPEPFGVQLVDLEQDLYRIQLDGFSGQEGGWLLNLRDVEGRRDVLAREGGDYPDLEISVREVRVDRNIIDHEGQTPVYERVARAVIYDHRDDREVVLYSDRDRLADEKTARFEATMAGLEGEMRRAREGEAFELGPYYYQVVEMNATTATVSRRSPDPEEPMRTETLTARDASGGDEDNLGEDEEQELDTGNDGRRPPPEDEPPPGATIDGEAFDMG